MQKIIQEFIQNVKNDVNVSKSLKLFKEKMEYWSQEELTELFEKEFTKLDALEERVVVKKFLNLSRYEGRGMSLVEIIGLSDPLYDRLMSLVEKENQEKMEVHMKELSPVIDEIINNLRNNVVDKEKVKIINEKYKQEHYCTAIEKTFEEKMSSLEGKERVCMLKNILQHYQEDPELYELLVNNVQGPEQTMIKTVLEYIEL